MNPRFGRIAAIATLASVLAFATSMIAGSDTASYISSMGIAWGFVPLVCALAAAARKEKRPAALTAVAFAAVYAVFIMAVYFAQVTVDMGQLSAETRSIIDYSQFGLFFSYDLLGYSFMALSTFFLSFALAPKDRGDKALVWLLRIHGVFAVSCVLMPVLHIFKPGMAGGDLMGVLVLEFWCAYFTPVCVLAYRCFRRRAENTEAGNI
jgi:hypothetical protein